ncbi:MAG TPA: hypothetical protein VHO84_06815 [Syntrophorhabdaceae bacterium]|nr:hypothetical protein [Syntrophorhabdaceae bacterium]
MSRPSVGSSAYPAALISSIQAFLTQRAQPLDECAHQCGALRRMSLQREMWAVQGMCLHTRERLHPGDGLLEIEKDVVSPP